jgi:hypothetical protein
LDATPEKPSERYVPRSERTKEPSSSATSSASSYTSSIGREATTSTYTSTRRDEKKEAGTYYKPSFTPTYTAEAGKRDYGAA